MKTPCALRFPGEYMGDAKLFASISAALAEYERAALQLWGWGQALDASIHILRNGIANEYPDYIVSLTRNGNVKKERA